jgi:transposase
MGYRKIDAELKGKAVGLVLDQGRTVPEACRILGLGPTALRRWIDEERQRRDAPPPDPVQVERDRAELLALRQRVAELEAEHAVLKKQLPSHLERLLGKPRRSSKR